MSGFASTVADRAEHLAVVYETESLTYAELDQRAAQLAHALTAAGARTGGPVGVLLPNCIEFIECLAACAKLRCPPLTLNSHLPADELAWVLADSGAQVVVAHVDLRPTLEAAVTHPTSPSTLAVLWVGDDYEPALDAAGDEPWPYAWSTAWPLMYTSGRAGRPRGVLHRAATSRDAMADAHTALAELWGYRPEDVHLVAGSLHHAAPLAYATTTLFVGGTVVLMERWDPIEALRLVETRRVTTTYMTPTHFHDLLCVSEATLSRFDITSLRHVLHGGAACPVEMKDRIMDLLAHSEVWELYGMAEGGVTRVGPEEWRRHRGTVGRPWPGVEVTIRDAETLEPLGPYSDGLIYVRPASGRFRYLHDDDGTAAAWDGDAFTVGDMGHLDDDGYLYLTDGVIDLTVRTEVAERSGSGPPGATGDLQNRRARQRPVL